MECQEERPDDEVLDDLFAKKVLAKPIFTSSKRAILVLINERVVASDEVINRKAARLEKQLNELLH